MARNFCLADPGGTREQKAANRLVWVAQTGPRQLHRGRQAVDRVVLTKHDMFEVAVEVLERLLIVLADRFGRDPRHRGNDLFNLARGDFLLAAAGRHQHLHRANFVDHIDCLVGQFAVVDVASRQFHRRFQRIGCVFHLVVIFESAAQPFQNFNRVSDGRLVHIDLLEPPQQGAVLLKMVAELFVSGRADAADRAA